MDSTGLYLTANYPYPNLKCVVNFKCDALGTISSNIVACSNAISNTWPYWASNNALISSLPISDLVLYGTAQLISVDVSQLFVIPGCSKSYWKIY